MKEVVYIANSVSENIEVWNLYKNGEMNLIQTVITDGQVQPLKIIKSKNLLYAGIRPNNRIITYCIDDNGFLKKKSESFIPGNPNYISLNYTKEFLFCSSYNSNCISVSPLNKYGIPQNPIQIIYNIEGCHSAKINYKYNILFVMSLKEDTIYLYHLTDHGILKNTEQKLLHTKKNSGPRHIIFHPNKDFIYTINELNGTIDVWRINKKNNIIQVENIQNINILNNVLSDRYWSSDIHITQCGRFLYASDRFLNIISLFHIDQKNYNITFFESYPTVEQPRSFSINDNNTYLIVTGEKSNTFILYSISQINGTLKKINIYNTSTNPIWILMHTINKN
ncbi:6-phosphogluconolactonase [Buchnera aphidicola (Brachycaudus cardui)]|uniref:6-phosphogluconolactonase n=1 Tax=Buchnera aphidicola (Brachycaudus cardui) TaxID=557993 RepID=A0A4D6Y2V5_9GAMM|nr:6-phosphogluconolactonase [Buchnera aphidicola]QCI20430.1 6-phosphogluconolactonase [Buchnera aphidicola (Brachycaudus cardui)]